MKKEKIDLYSFRLSVVSSALRDLSNDLDAVDRMSVEDYKKFASLVIAIKRSLLGLDLLLSTVSVPCDCILDGSLGDE